MARARHSSFTTTQGYIDLAGETFREEADRLERRLWGRDQYKKPVQPGRFVARDGNGAGSRAGRRNRVSSGSSLGYGAAQESNLPSVGLPRLTGFEDRLGHRAPPLHSAG